jgi:hypothetical protein
MTIEEIQTALAELVAAMVEKNVSQPNAHLTIKEQGERHLIYLTSAYRSSTFGKDKYDKICHGTTIAGAFEQARKDIAALPSPEEVVTREYLGKVGDAIDYATKHSIDDEYVTPLRGVTCAMTSNLLTKEAAE